MDRLTDASKLDGWIPWRFNAGPGRPTVDWCYLGRERFTPPSFDQVISECMTRPFNLLFGHQTPIELLGELQQLSPGITPKGFIFHLSRSGSTLISRTLAASATNIVISEARPIDSVLRAHSRDSSISVSQRIEWLRWMINSLAQPRRGGERNVFVEFHDWNIFELPIIRSAFPEVASVFVYEEPLEVLVSQMGHRGAHMVPGVIDPRLFGMDSNLLKQIEPEEYCARVLGAICKAALQLRIEGGLLIDQGQLPGVIFSTIPKFFGVRWTETESELMRSTICRYSNSPGKVNRSDSPRHEKARERLREAAERWVYPIYQELEAARLSN